MMQDQGIECIASTSEKENSMYTEAHTTTSGQLNIDFGNVEDILDFSAPCVPTPTVINKPMTKEPLQMQPSNSNNKLSENDAINRKTEPKQKVKFQCTVCGDQFVQSHQLHHHMSIHARAKPYYCSVCRIRFSTKEYMLAHFYTHRNDNVHCCCVCSEAYYDLETFSNHCRTHDDSLYIKMALTEPSDSSDSELDSVFDSPKEPLIVKDCVRLPSYTKKGKPYHSVTTREECIAYVENPLYHDQSHHKAISINSNVATSHSDADSLMISINVVHFLPSS